MSYEENDSVVIDREPCPKCQANGNDNSGDNLARYDDGHGYCFACGHFEKGDDDYVAPERADRDFNPYRGSCVEIPSRWIEEKTCRRYGYQVATSNGKEFHIANYYKNQQLVAQHLRGVEPKSFKWTGSPKGCELFGQNLWSEGGKRLVITEGEIDCLTVNQLLGGTWPVVSLPNGVQSAVKDIKQNIEFINSFGDVIIMFDMDDAGQEAATKVAGILPPGKAKIAKLPNKDANECLTSGEGKVVVNAIWQAQEYKPDEILHVGAIKDDVEQRAQAVYPFPWDTLSEFLLGQRSHELTLWTSGTGSGKSTILRELAMHHLTEGRSVGMVMLEESPLETRDDMVSLIMNKPVRSIRAAEMMNKLRVSMGKEEISVETGTFEEGEYEDALGKLAATKLYIYDHLGQNAMANILARIEYMATALGVDVIILDHITAMAAGLLGADKDVHGGNSERILIDTVMKELRAISVRTGVHIDIVSQLKKTDKAYEEGSRITLQDLRGSGSLSSVPNTVVSLERNRQAPSDRDSNTTLVRVLKNRMTGRAGAACALYFNRITGRLEETEFTMGDDGKLMLDPGTNTSNIGDPFAGI